MKLYIFNPEHDLALAQANKYFTAPKAAMKLRSDLAYIPALWADDNSLILVENIEEAIKQPLVQSRNVIFTDGMGLRCYLSKITEIVPWGWDICVKYRLWSLGIPDHLLPDNAQLSIYKELSNRKTSIWLFENLRKNINHAEFVGNPRYVTSLAEIKQLASQYKRAVLKAPWSSSGRGIRFIDSQIDTPRLNWAKNVISCQGGIVIEPRYEKIQDFAMEFLIDSKGANFLGLSLFSTTNGSYMGNVLTSEEEKQKILSNYVPLPLLDNLKEELTITLAEWFSNKYNGPLGVDMMIVKKQSSGDIEQIYAIHPMVEINLRYTMGYAALAFSKIKGNMHKTMQIAFSDNHYYLEIT